MRRGREDQHPAHKNIHGDSRFERQQNGQKSRDDHQHADRNRPARYFFRHISNGRVAHVSPRSEIPSRGTIAWVGGRDARKEERDIHSTPVACNPFSSPAIPFTPTPPALEKVRRFLGLRYTGHAIRSVNDLGDIMANDSHQRAAEFHMLAAHAHQAAAAHHGKEDHLTAHEQSRQAMEYASKAFEFSKQAHDESSVIFKKHEKKT